MPLTSTPIKPSYPGKAPGEFRNIYALAALRADGSVVTWGDAFYGGNSNAVASQIDGTLDVTQLFSTTRAFAALRVDGSVVTWGSNFGGDSSAVASQLDGSNDVVELFSTVDSFAALRVDGSVVTWGSGFGGDSSAVASELNGTVNVMQIFSTSAAFVALRDDGSAVTWGGSDFGGDSSAVSSALNGTIEIVEIFSDQSAFAALRADGSVVTWGLSYWGGDSSSVASALDGTVDVVDIFSAVYAFAALRADGSVVTWGGTGGNSSSVASALNGTIDVIDICSNELAFAALRADGSVVTWGGDRRYPYGGDSSSVASALNGTIDVVDIFSTSSAFAALRADGSVVTWGDSGGDSSAVASALNGTIDVVNIFSTESAFAALRADGSVVTWGGSGGDSRVVAGALDGTIDVVDIFSTTYAFAALRADGSVVTWGDNSTGGSSSAVANQIDGTIDVVSMANPFTNDVYTAGASPSDTTAPIVTTFSPTDEATGVPVASNIVLTFNEAIARGTGNIVLKTSTGNVFETFNASSSNLTVSGSTLTINPTSDLAAGTAYKVEFAAGSVNDLAGNAYAGTGTYNFTTASLSADTTAPTVTTFSPADETTRVAIGSNIVLTFNEAIARGTGNIVLKTSTGNVIETFNAASSSNLTLSGSTLTINPTSDLAAGTAYKVEFAAGSIKDLANNPYTGTTSYNFATAASTSDDYLNNTSTTGRVQVCGGETGILETPYDSDWFAIQLSEGLKYRFNVEGAELLFLPDLVLHNIAGDSIDSGFDGNSINYTPTGLGTYYLSVENIDVNDINSAGAYTVTAEVVGYTNPTSPPTLPEQLLNQVQATPDNQSDLIIAGAFFATIVYGDTNIGIADLTASHTQSEYTGLLDNGFDDNYAKLLTENPRQLGDDWEVLTPRCCVGQDDVYDMFTDGGLFHSYIPSQEWDPHTDQSSEINGVLYGNSNALVTQSSDTLVLAFRGTDGDDDAFIDGQAWTGDGQYLHYEAFRPLIESTLNYVQCHPEIKHIVVSGHSLGGSMVDIFTAVDAWRFSALEGSDLTIVAMASAGIAPDAITATYDDETFNGYYDHSVVTTENVGLFSGYLTEHRPDFYFGFANNLDRVFFPVLDDVGMFDGYNPNASLLNQSNFDSTVFFLPNIENNDASYPVNFKNPMANGFGAHHNGFIYYKNIYTYLSSPVYQYSIHENYHANLDVTVSDSYNSYLHWSPSPRLIIGTGEYPDDENWLEQGVGDTQISDSGSFLGFSRDLIGTGGNDFILGLEGNDVLKGGSGNDCLDGGSGDDILVGDSGGDYFYGGDGNDSLYGTLQASGADNSIGVEAFDVAIYPGYHTEYQLDSSGAYYTITDINLSNGDEGQDRLYGIESVVFADIAINLSYRFVGIVADGYIAGAALYLDADGDGIADTEEATGVVTDSQGNFTLQSSPTSALIAIGGTNVDTGLPNTMTLSAPAGSTVVTPLTTLVNQVARLNALDTSAAETLVQSALGLSADVDLTQYDPLAQVGTNATALAVQQLAAQVATVVTLAPQGDTSFTSIAAALTRASGQHVDLTDTAVLQAILPNETPATLKQAADINQAIEYSADLAGISAIQQVALNDSNDAPLLITPLADQRIAQGAAYSFVVAATAFVDLDAGDSLSFSASLATGSPLPAWLRFNSATQAFDGTPSALDMGELDIKVTVTDMESATASDVFRLSISSVIAGQALTGTSGSDTLIGSSGNDTLIGQAGADHLDGGEGFDTADYSSAPNGVAVYLTWAAGNSGDAAGDTFNSIEGLTGSAFADVLSGSAGDNTIQAGLGNDWLFGQEGADYLDGGTGSDVLSGGMGGDFMDGGDGADVAYYRDAAATIYSVAQHGSKLGMLDGHSYGISIDASNILNSFGEATNDLLLNIENIWGSRFDDVIRADDYSGGQVFGFEGDDILDGRGGNDIFYGGTGADTLTGGTGADDFFYLSYNDHYNQYGTLEAYEGGDNITDFEIGIDHITVSRYWFGFGNIQGVAQSLTSEYANFITNGAAPANSKPSFLWNPSSGVLQYDADGAGATAAVNLVTLLPGINLSLGDIWTA